MKTFISMAALVCCPMFLFGNSQPTTPESEVQLNEYIDIEEDVTCTVTLYAKLDGGGNWTFVSAGVEGSVQFESTKETCADAVNDIKGGMKAIF